MAYQVGDLDVSISGQVDNAIDRITTLSKALSRVKAQLNAINKGTTASKISKDIGGGYSSQKSSDNSNLAKATKRFNIGFVFSKIKLIYQFAVKTAKAAYQILKYGVDYTETLNLWQVAMGNNLSMATEFVQKMNKAYGISEKTLMNAQAIFKNMIGSLGQISETTAYNLSEAITQMAIDYSSLYNVSIESAINKFQAALAGQVRPIRSVSGYDITENTLFQLYQSLGGTKTMRQLSRTEKQLLSIYAVFKQMGASGALGDMEKTIGQVANQTRMMRENFEQMLTWAGVSLQYLLQEYEVFKYINATLIFAGELLKSIAYSLGYETPDFANSWADNVEDTSKAIDTLNGKLADFDKFRSLNDSEENVLGIDTKLLEAISNYTSEIGNATNKARELAEQWLKVFGFVYDSEQGIFKSTKTFEEFLNDLPTYIGEFGKYLSNTINNIDVYEIVDWIEKIVFAIIDSLTEFIKNIDIGEFLGKLTNAITEADWESLLTKLVNFIDTLLDVVIKEFVESLKKTDWGDVANLFVAALLNGFSQAIYWGFVRPIEDIINFFVELFGGEKIDLKKYFPVFSRENISSAWQAIGISEKYNNTIGSRILSGIGNIFNNGSVPDKRASLFANNNGFNLGVSYNGGNSSNGLQQAMYNAMSAYGATHNESNQNLTVYLDGEVVYKNTTSHAKRNGYVWGKA